jgi:hypothetical protein
MPHPQPMIDDNSLGATAFMWVPLAEFVDRYLITRVKSINQGAADCGLSPWQSAHENLFSEICTNSDEVRALCTELETIHGQLWVLESAVRASAPLTDSDFGKLARRIFSLNSVRHDVKEKLNSLLNSFTFGKRIYR